MNVIEEIKQTLKYMDILAQHHVIFNDENCDGLKKMDDDLVQIFETLPIIINQMNSHKLEAMSKEEHDKKFIQIKDELKYLANILVFIDTMKPLAMKYNPSEEDKAKLLDFIGYKGEKDES